MLNKIKEVKRCEVNVTTVTVRKQLYKIQYNASRESANAFLDRFEEIVHNYETISGSTLLADDEKRDALYNAVMKQIPEVPSVEFLTKNQTGKSLTYDLLKSFIMQAEANRLQAANINHPSSKTNTLVSVSFTNSSLKLSIERCFECGDSGHMKNECPRKGSGLRKCYECGQFSNHVAAECPQRLAKYGKNFNKNSGRDKRYKSNNTYENHFHANHKRSFKPKNNQNKNSSNSKPAREYKSRQFKRNDSSSHKTNEPKQNQSRTGTSGSPQIQSNSKGMYQNSLSHNIELKLQFKDRKQSLLSTYFLQNLKFKNLNNDESNENFVSFIIDSGATEHLTKSKEIFSTFEKTKISVIKCANKNDEADLFAQGHGTVNIISNSDNKKSLQLENTIYTNLLSENLLSLRKFADAGLSTYLDKECVNIYDPKTKEVYDSDVYDMPYWVMEFRVDKKDQEKQANPSDVFVFDTSVVEKNENKIDESFTSELIEMTVNNDDKINLLDSNIDEKSSAEIDSNLKTVKIDSNDPVDNECKTTVNE